MRSSAAATADVVRAVADRDVEAPAPRPAGERAAARDEAHRPCSASAPAAVAADRRVRDPEALTQLERLSEVARRHLDLVPVLAHRLDQRAQHEHMGAVRQVDPDAHCDDHLAHLLLGQVGPHRKRDVRARCLLGRRGGRRRRDRGLAVHRHAVVAAADRQARGRRAPRTGGRRGVRRALSAGSTACSPRPSRS